MIKDYTPTPAKYADMKAEEARRQAYGELIPLIRFLLVEAGGEVTISQQVQDLNSQDIEITRNVSDGSITLRLREKNSE